MPSTNHAEVVQINSRTNAPDNISESSAPLLPDNSKQASFKGGMAVEIAAACFVAFLLGLSSLTYPLGADQGILAVWAQELARGAVPYRDIWEQRPPLFYFLIYFGYLAGLREHLLVRVVDLILQIATAGVLSALGRRWFGRFAGILTGFFYAFSYFGMVSYHHQAQPESLYGLLLGIALLLHRQPFFSSDKGDFRFYSQRQSGGGTRHSNPQKERRSIVAHWTTNAPSIPGRHSALDAIYYERSLSRGWPPKSL